MKLLKNIILIFGIFFLTSCERLDLSKSPKIFVSIGPLHSFVQELIGTNFLVGILLPENMDPHTYSPTVKQMVELNHSKIFFHTGMLFDKLLLEGFITNDVNCIDVSTGIELISNDESEEHDPHYWLAPQCMRIILKNIYDVLWKLYPSEIENINKRWLELDKKLANLSENGIMRMNKLSNKSLLTHYSTWKYFAREFGLQEIVLQENGKEPCEQHLENIIDQIDSYNFKFITVQPGLSSKLPKVLIENKELKIFEINKLSSNYFEIINAMLSELENNE